MASLYKTSGWHVTSEGTAETPSVRFHEDRYEAERQYHLYCAAAATSSYPTDVAVLETVDGRQLKRECYYHGTEEEETEETTEA